MSDARHLPVPGDIVGDRAEAAVRVVAEWFAACDAEGSPAFPEEGQIARLEAALSASAAGFDADEAARAVAAVRDYLSVLAYALGPDMPLTAVDPRRSVLLLRLLAGRRALAEAPPRDGGRPWYELAETPGPHACAVQGEADMSGRLGTLEPGDDGLRLLVNGVPWRIEERRADGSYAVRWQGRGPLYEVRRQGEGWAIRRIAGAA